MVKNKYRLENCIITEYDESLITWEEHAAIGELISGKCYRIGDILILGESNQTESGFLILEFSELQKKLPVWSKTSYYCQASRLRGVTTGREVTETILQELCAKFRSSEASLNSPGEYQLHKYKIIIEKNFSIQWETYAEANSTIRGNCSILSGILLLDFTHPQHFEAQGKKEWHQRLKSLPHWDKTAAWVLENEVKKCRKDIDETKCPTGNDQESRNISSSGPSKKKESKRMTPFPPKQSQREKKGKPFKSYSTERKNSSRQAQSVLVKDILPFFIWITLLLAAVLTWDFLLHKLVSVRIEKYLGIPGLLLLISSFLYTMKKRKMIISGTLKTFLSLHIYLAWIGTLLIMIHAGIHFNAFLPWAAFLMMLAVVISGLIGEYILKSARKTLKERYSCLLDQGNSKEEVERKVILDALFVKAMQRWRIIHKPLSLMFAVLTIIHISTIILFIGWFK